MNLRAERAAEPEFDSKPRKRVAANPLNISVAIGDVPDAMGEAGMLPPNTASTTVAPAKSRG